MRIPCTGTLGLVALVALSLSAAARGEVTAVAPTVDVAQARWDVRDIEFTYSGITTAYSCTAVERKIRSIVLAVGGHPTTTVRASGCAGDRPARTLFLRLTTAIPRPASEPQSSAAVDREKLLARLGVRKEFQGEFPVRRQTVRLADAPKLSLAAGDCELIIELRNSVFPKLGLQVVEESNLDCIPRQLSIGTPSLSVTALLPSGDASAADRGADAKR